MVASKKGWSRFADLIAWRIRQGSLSGFNAYDIHRIRQVGPDRNAAEWIVRCNGKVKFNVSSQLFDDYNNLQRFTSELDPRKKSDQIHLVYVDATDSCIDGDGCMNFLGLHHLEEIKFVQCYMLNNIAFINNITHPTDGLIDCLRRLHIENCPLVTERGLNHLVVMKKLDSLVLRDLPWVEKTELLKHFKNELPTCKIILDE